MGGHPQRLAKHAVDPHPDHQAGLVGLDMDVGDALAGGVGDDSVDQPDGGRVVGAVEQVVGGGQVAGEMAELVAEAERSGRVGGRLLVHRVALGEELVEALGGRRLDRERPPEHPPGLDQGARVGAVAKRDPRLPVRLADQGDAVALGEQVRKVRVHGLAGIIPLSRPSRERRGPSRRLGR